MSTAIKSTVQNLRVMQRETERPDLAREREKTERPRGPDSDIAKEAKDTVEIRSASRPSDGSNPAENEIRDGDGAQRSVTEINELINTENGRLSAEQANAAEVH